MAVKISLRLLITWLCSCRFILTTPAVFWLTALLHATVQQQEDSQLQRASKYFKEVQRNTRFSRIYSLSIDVLSCQRIRVLSGNLLVCGRKWRELLLMRFNRTNGNKTTQKECFGVDIVPKLVLILIISIHTKFKSTVIKNPFWRETTFPPVSRPRVIVRQKMRHQHDFCLIC